MDDSSVGSHVSAPEVVEDRFSVLGCRSFKRRGLDLFRSGMRLHALVVMAALSPLHASVPTVPSPGRPRQRAPERFAIAGSNSEETTEDVLQRFIQHTNNQFRAYSDELTRMFARVGKDIDITNETVANNYRMQRDDYRHRLDNCDREISFSRLSQTPCAPRSTNGRNPRACNSWHSWAGQGIIRLGNAVQN